MSDEEEKVEKQEELNVSLVARRVEGEGGRLWSTRTR